MFSTGMTGYQETLTDPSYHRQIVVQTAPQIGNTGWNDRGRRVRRIWVAGYVVRDPARRRPTGGRRARCEDELVEQGVVGIAGVDTRALTRHLREHGAMRAGIFSGDGAERGGRPGGPGPGEPADAGRRSRQARSPRPRRTRCGARADSASAWPRSIWASRRTPHVGWRRAASRCTSLPASTALERSSRVEPRRGVPVQRPGDPATQRRRDRAHRRVLERELPLFGICFGNQILGRAFGPSTYKMRFGHRGINIPVIDVGHRPGRRSPRRTTASRSKASRDSGSSRRSARRRSAITAPTTAPSRVCAAWTCRRSRCSTTRRPPPARTTRQSPVRRVRRP